MKMHDDEADLDADLVGRLVAAQFPRLAGLPVTPFRSTGTVNAIYRLGDHLYARLPRVSRWARDLETESHWLPRLAPGLSPQVPEPVAMGRPGDGYPWSWAIYRWIDGQPYADELVADERQAAWDRALEAPAWDGRTPTWIHADLLRPNLLVDRGRLRAVIDWGAAGAGDPAADLIAAWAVFGPDGREAFRGALSDSDGAWDRACGVALHQAVMLIPYYRETNPGMAALGRRTVGQVLADLRARGGDAAGPGPSARSRW
jgi:aminoglycoside phosphotransferase (APT) family kinase protein